MSALARYCQAQGMQIWGYDKTPSKLTEELANEGIEVSYEDHPKGIPSMMLANPLDVWIIYTPAVPEKTALRTFFSQHEFTMVKRATLLGMISEAMDTLAIAGTHGKTTSTNLAAWVLSKSEGKGNAFLGGISGNFNSNVLIHKDSERLVVEADEYDRSFHALHPQIALITANDPDHLDIYGTDVAFYDAFNQFANQVNQQGCLVVNEQVEIRTTHPNVFRYGWEKNNHYYPVNCEYKASGSQFNLHTPEGTIDDLYLNMVGKHNVMNAVGVAASMLNWGVKPKAIKEAFATFKGVKRRFEHICKLANNGVYIDDYAHHPRELNAAIGAAKAIFPAQKITGVFQPHLYSRTSDFMDEFAHELAQLDVVYLLPIYAAREEPLEGISSNVLLAKIDNSDKWLVEKEQLVEKLKQQKPEVLLTLGAGDIDRMVEPIKEALAV